MKEKDNFFDDKYFRYLLSSRNIKISDLALTFNISIQALNRKILNGKFKLVEIFIIMDILSYDFKDIFKKK